ncbi:MAG: GLPGLI family protein [Prevotellaceae bacterium]|jgi:GLPGLI family protein|nr:GLPGLI family protein [Prevotellaceae bacterium]
MKKILILTASIVLFYMQLNSQETLDTAYLECSYTFTQMIDTITQKKSVRDVDMRLLIGAKYSKFYSHRLFSADSILKTMTTDEQMFMLSNGGFTDFINKYGSSEAYKVYTNHIENKITQTDMRAPKNVLYKESVPKQNWKILSEIKDFDGYKCQKATCTFRGRDYVAWFTREIPVKEGPWKFNGLPGLIVKVHDTQEHYDFELSYINKIRKKIIFEEKNYPEITLKDYIKVCRYKIQHPLEYLMNSGKNVRTTFSPDPKPYDVMERDIK